MLVLLESIVKISGDLQIFKVSGKGKMLAKLISCFICIHLSSCLLFCLLSLIFAKAAV